MDVVFHCSHCKQELAADSSGSGSEIHCPACNAKITIPAADVTNIHILNPIASSAAAREEKHFSVPVHDGPSEILVEKPKPPLEVAARESERKLRIKCFKRSECVEVGHEKFDEVVTEFLGRIGETNMVEMHPLTYTHLDIGSQKLMTDYGVMIIYRG